TTHQIKLLYLGETVTLRCDIDGEGVTSWQYSWYKDGSFYTYSKLKEHTFSPVTESDAGKYSCYGAERGGSCSSNISDEVTLTVSERAIPKVSIKPAQHVFRGETVTLRCDIDGEGVTSWQYSWYKDSSFYNSSELQEHTFSPVTESDAGKYSCYGAERRSRTSNISYAVTLTVSDIPTPTLTVLPQSSLFTGDSVTLRCEMDRSWDGWEFLWSKNSNTESTEAATKTIDSVKVSDGGEYRCRARRGGYYTHYSEPVTGVSKSTFAILTTEKRLARPGAWSKWVVPILLMSNGCFLGVMCNKPIRVSSSIPFKSQLRSCHDGFAIYTRNLASANTEPVSEMKRSCSCASK
uniref:Ig-like domain-containing protein n=1 Tax=Cyprinus carpio TaxID=7962 RepID=A0A8C2L0X8_CYPCA